MKIQSFKSFLLTHAPLSERIDKTLKTVKFMFGADSDYPLGDSIITFDDKEINQYKKEGNTAGLISHGCKHLYDWDKQYVEMYVDKFRAAVIEKIQTSKVSVEDGDPSFDVTIFKQCNPDSTTSSSTSTTKKSALTDKQAISLIKSAPTESIVNFFDLVNDKMQQGNTESISNLTIIERLAVPCMRKIGLHYGDLIKRYADKAVSIDDSDSKEEVEQKIKGNTTFAFNCDCGTKVIIDRKDNVLIVSRHNTFRTAFKTEDVIDRVSTKIVNRKPCWDPINPHIVEFFADRKL